jgi:uncharacterized membrane protein YgcG
MMGDWHNRWGRRTIALSLATLAAAATALPASAEMRSTRISRHVCKTVHGGRFVPIPGFPAEKIDRRLLPDIRWMKRRFDIFITDGYSLDPVHAANGEHPIGLATDIVPNTAKGGTWNDIADLAHLAEPQQNAPIPPWRWVGWNGDAGHGRGNHLHLSWMHSDAQPGHVARVVYTRKCPTPPKPPPASTPHHKPARPHHKPSTGGTSSSGGSAGSGGTSTGGTSASGGGGHKTRGTGTGGLSPKLFAELMRGPHKD